jgi:hypothetical protein
MGAVHDEYRLTPKNARISEALPPFTRGSVRELRGRSISHAPSKTDLTSSQLAKTPISLIDPKKGEGKAHACANAWLRQLSAQVRGWRSTPLLI